MWQHPRLYSGYTKNKSHGSESISVTKYSLKIRKDRKNMFKNV